MRHTYRKLAAMLYDIEEKDVVGDGAYVCVSYCPPEISVHLFKKKVGAITAKVTIDRCGCGGSCESMHAVDVIGGASAYDRNPMTRVANKQIMRTRDNTGE